MCRLLLQHRETIRFVAYTQGVVEMVWSGDVCFKQKHGWAVPPRQPYSPDLAPSDFHLFEARQVAIRVKRFGSHDEAIEEVKKWLRVQNSNCYKKGIDAIFFRWRKAVDFYVKNEVCNTSIYLRYVNVTSIISKITSK
jgi:hypothetical protein